MKIDSKGERPNVSKLNSDFKFNSTDTSSFIRYLFSTKFIDRGDKVLDIGSGYGHGSFLQSFWADYVEGLDYSEEAVEVSNNLTGRYSLNNVNFTNKKVQDLGNIKSSYDVITAFEIIEHIEKEEGIQMVKHSKDLLNNNGVFLVSTPNIDLRGKTYWKHHKHEYYSRELKEILNDNFEYVESYYQSGDGMNVSKGFIRSLLLNPATSNSVIIFVCSEDKESFEVNSSNDPSFIYSLLRGLYRNIKHFTLGG